MLILFIGLYFFSAKRRSTIINTIFSSMLIISFVNIFLDLLFIMNSRLNNEPPRIIDKFYLITLIGYVALLHCWIFNNIKNEKGSWVLFRSDILSLIPAGISMIVVLVTTSSYELNKGWFVGSGIPYYSAYVAISAYVISIICMLIINYKCIPFRTMIVTSTAFVALVASLISQLVVNTNTIVSVGVTVSIIAVYMVAENSDVLLIEKLSYEKDRANDANASKTSFIANMSHEIRTPINAILGMNEMIIRESQEENIVQYAQDISTAAYSLYGIINDVLDVSKIDSGKMEIMPVKYNLNQMIYDAIALNKSRIDAKQLDFIAEVNPNIPNGYYGDDIRIKQVLTNLLSNAVKYTHEGFVKLTVDGEYRGDYMDLIFQVKDTGIGIKEEDLNKLFVAFERIEEERNRNIEGTGLGMTITNDLLRLMGARLKVSSQYGEGSIFSFVINQRIVNQEPVGDFNAYVAQEREYSKVGYTAPDVKLLVVDDNALNRKVFASLLNGTEIHIDEANSGYECMDMIRMKQYDIIFLDHLMPVMDGIETMKLIKENRDHLNRKTPVIMLTANSLDSIKEAYNSAGFDAYLSKPIFSADLHKLIKAYLPTHKIKYNNENDDKDDGLDWKDRLPSIRGINWKVAISHLPTEEILRATLKDFRQSIVQEARILDACVADIDNPESLELFRIKVHAIKSSSGMIGAEMLSEGAKELEFAAKDHNVELIREKYTYMINYYRSFLSRLEEFDDGAKEKNDKIDFPQVLALAEMVRLEMFDMNKQNAIDAIDEIEAYEYPEDINNELIKLRMAVDDFDSEKVGNIVDNLIEMIRLLRSMME